MYEAKAEVFPWLISSKTFTPPIVVVVFAETRPACIQ
jgi:hypothetical protein